MTDKAESRLDKERRAIQRITGEKLPKQCECGGLMEYAYSFSRVWSGCLKCTPVSKINVNRLRNRNDKP